MSDREPLPFPHADLHDIDDATITDCIEACYACVQACTACADACLSADSVIDLATCVRANLDCADMCESTGRLLSRRFGQPTNLAKAFLDTCAMSCADCAEECARVGDELELCKQSAEACRRCEHACRTLVAALA